VTPAARRRRPAASPAKRYNGPPPADRPAPTCNYGNPRCGAQPARPYPCGPMCDEHQPANTHPFYRRPQ
jgi:hypothetical protein